MNIIYSTPCPSNSYSKTHLLSLPLSPSLSLFLSTVLTSSDWATLTDSLVTIWEPAIQDSTVRWTKGPTKPPTTAPTAPPRA